MFKLSHDGQMVNRVGTDEWLAVTSHEVVSWIDAGNSLAPADPIPVAPLVCSAAQIRLALSRTGLRGAVEAAVKAGSQDLRDIWEYSTAIHSDNIAVRQMAQQIGVTDDQLADLFKLAVTL